MQRETKRRSQYRAPGPVRRTTWEFRDWAML